LADQKHLEQDGDLNSLLINRFIRLARVVIEGSALPFLGAGVSTGARLQKDRSLKPTVSWMIKTLIKEAMEIKTIDRLCCCLKLLFKETIEIKNIDKLCDCLKLLSKEEKNKECNSDIIIRLIGGQLGKLCEVLEQEDILDHSQIVKTLRIKDFSDLQPVPAHYYIAFLVHEGLINEVITTNYDCCLRKAIENTSQKSNHIKSESIFDLESYRKKGSRRLLPHNGNILRVYKINGCAKNLLDKENYKSILLTEKQLQHMDNRKWAKDLLRDRARSRSIIFSGFGSDEPQVRFTILRLIEEFSKDGTNNNTNDKEPKNPIWVHAYGSLTFSQKQLMHSYWRAHNSVDIKQQINQHTFTGEDIEKLYSYLGIEKEGKDKEHLPADLFWQTLFEIIFLALIERYSSPHHPGWNWFASLDEPSSSKGMYRQYEFMKWLDPEGIAQIVLDNNDKVLNNNEAYIRDDTNKQYLKTINKILGYYNRIPGIITEKDIKVEGIPLSLWLHCLAGKSFQCHSIGDNTYIPECLYIRLSLSLNLVLSLLSLWCFLNDTEGNEDSIPFEVKVDELTSPPLLFFKLHKKKLFLYSSLINPMEDKTSFLEDRSIISVFFNYPYLVTSKTIPRCSYFFQYPHKRKIAIRRIIPLYVEEIIKTYLLFKTEDLSKTDKSNDNAEELFTKLFIKLLIESNQVFHRQTHRAKLKQIKSKK